MPFPLFGLPIELREQIYFLYFQPILGNASVTPDPRRNRKRCIENKCEKSLPSPSDIALLQTCQQIHEEATKVLYSTKVFYFDDSPHGDFTHAVEASDHCHFCHKYRSIRDRDCLTDVIWDHCWHNYNDRHYVHIPQCDFVTMGKWLREIGRHNLSLVKHIHLHFTGAQFTKVLRMYYPHEGYRGKPCPVGGDLVVDALELLGRSHCLKTLKISFSEPAENSDTGLDDDVVSRSVQCAFRDTFSPDSRVGAALRKVRGLTHFYCDAMGGTFPGKDGHDMMDDARFGMLDSRKQMELGGVMRKQEPRDSAAFWSHLSRWQQESVNQSMASSRCGEDLGRQLGVLELE